VVVVDDRESRSLSQPWAQLLIEGMDPIVAELSDQGTDPADSHARDHLLVARLVATTDAPLLAELTVSDLAPGDAGRVLERRTVTLEPNRPIRVEVTPRQALGRSTPRTTPAGAEPWVASPRRRGDGGPLPLLPGPLGLGLLAMGLGITWHTLRHTD